jgi:hypothetical protein
MRPLPDPAAVATAIMADVRTRMPSLTQIAAAGDGKADPHDMGPDLTLPALHMHLVIQYAEALRLELARKAMDLVFAERASIGVAPDDVGDARAIYAARIAQVVVASLNGGHEEAVSSLLQAAASILASRYEGRFAAHALETGAAMFADEIRRSFSPTGPLQ